MTQSMADLERSADQAAAAGDASTAARLLAQVVEQQPKHMAAWIKLSAMRRAAGDLTGALAAVESALALDPLDFGALLSRAFLLDRSGDRRANEAFAVAAAQAPAEEELPRAMQAALAHARQKAEEHRSGLEQRLLAAVSGDLDGPAARRVRRFASNSARRTRHFHQEPTHFHYPGMPEIEVHDRSAFPALDALEAGTDRILAEFEALIAAEAGELVPYSQYPEGVPLGQWEELNNNPDWTAIHLLQNGKRVEANARHCPETMAILAGLPQPQVPGASPNAMFSLLAPGTHIPPHTGVANTRLVCHLPLVVPPNCGFRVGETRLEWRKGEAFVFDDTIEHEAWNDSDRLRVVLIVDLWPPALGKQERAAVAAMIPAAGVSFSGGM